MLQAWSEQKKKRSNPSYQEFQDYFTPSKVGEMREKINPSYRIMKTGYRIQPDAGYRILDTVYRIQIYRILDT